MIISFLLLFTNLFVVLSTYQKEMVNNSLKDLNKEFSFLRKLNESGNSTSTNQTNTSTTNSTNQTDTSTTNSTNQTDTSTTNSTNQTDTSTTNSTNQTDTSTTNSTTQTDTPTTNNTIYTETDRFLIGFDNYSYSNNSILTFNIYFKLYSNHEDILILPLIIVPKSSRVRALDENRNANCTLERSSQDKPDNIDIYKCKASYSGEIQNVKLREEGLNYIFSSLANATKNNIERETNIYLNNVKEFKNLSNSEIYQQTPTSFEIRGDGLTGEDSSNNIILITTSNGVRTEIPCSGNLKKYTDQDQEQYSLQCTLNEKLNANLNNNIGLFKNNESKIFEVIFSKENLNTTIDNYHYDNYKNQKSSGLSTGGIIAITIPCIIVLLAILGLVFYLRSKNPNPPVQDIAVNNNTIGISGPGSSQYIVTK